MNMQQNNNTNWATPLKYSVILILGIFLVAFYAKKVGGTAVFWAAIVGEIFVIVCFLLDKYNIVGIGFLWLNVIGAVFVFLLSILFSKLNRHAI